MKLNVEMNEKISPLPSGLENYRYFSNGIVRNFDKAYKLNQKLKNQIVYYAHLTLQQIKQKESRC